MDELQWLSEGSFQPRRSAQSFLLRSLREQGYSARHNPPDFFFWLCL
jgi:hypothetical protein